MSNLKPYRAQCDPFSHESLPFRSALLRESVQAMLDGDVDTGKAILRDYINATIGFEKLSAETHKPAKSLMRMFSPTGNPQAKNLFEVIAYLKNHEGISLNLDQ